MNKSKCKRERWSGREGEKEGMKRRRKEAVGDWAKKGEMEGREKREKRKKERKSINSRELNERKEEERAEKKKYT